MCVCNCRRHLHEHTETAKQHWYPVLSAFLRNPSAARYRYCFAVAIAMITNTNEQHTVGRRALGTISDTPVELKVDEFKKPEPKPFSSVTVGTGTLNLERSTLVSRTRSRRR